MFFSFTDYYMVWLGELDEITYRQHIDKIQIKIMLMFSQLLHKDTVSEKQNHKIHG